MSRPDFWYTIHQMRTAQVTMFVIANVSDIDYMARTSSLSKTELTLIYGGVAVLHAVRVHYDGHYADFFVRPAPDGGLHIGVTPRSFPH